MTSMEATGHFSLCVFEFFVFFVFFVQGNQDSLPNDTDNGV